LPLGALRALLSHPAVLHLPDEHTAMLVITRDGAPALRVISSEVKPAPEYADPNPYVVRIDDLDLLVRTANLLHREGLVTVGNLVRDWSWAQLEGLRQWNAKTTADLRASLDVLGVVLPQYSLPPDPAPNLRAHSGPDVPDWDSGSASRSS